MIEVVVNTWYHRYFKGSKMFILIFISLFFLFLYFLFKHSCLPYKRRLENVLYTQLIIQFFFFQLKYIVTCFSFIRHMLMIVDNEEYYEQEKPLSLKDIRSLIILLRQVMFWNGMPILLRQVVESWEIEIRSPEGKKVFIFYHKLLKWEKKISLHFKKDLNKLYQFFSRMYIHVYIRVQRIGLKLRFGKLVSWPIIAQASLRF